MKDMKNMKALGGKPSWLFMTFMGFMVQKS
jgi:hypothetical protein